jgi:predicted DNA-binding transcriptional regulator AlpA
MSDPLPSPEEIRAAFSPAQADLLLRLLSAPKAPVSPSPPLTIEEAADRLGKSKSWLYHHRKRLGMGFKVGGELRFLERDLERFLRVRSRCKSS